MLAIYDKPDPLEGPYFEESLYVTPSRHARGDLERVVETLERSISALGLSYGPVHAELRFDATGAILPVAITREGVLRDAVK